MIENAEYDTQTLSSSIVARLNQESERLTLDWNNSGKQTARYFTVDDLLPLNVAMEVVSRFPTDKNLWHQRDSFRERKKTFAKLDAADPLILAVTESFHTDEVVAAISRITALPNLEPDADLYAGGISLMERGDFLNPHIDNSHDKTRSRYRRLNLLYYVSPYWALEKGGNLELWERTVRRPLTLTSAFNRLIVMETDRNSWHSVSPVIADESRCCVSNYYFSTESPDTSEYYHVTSFMGRPGQHLNRAFARFDNWIRQTVAQRLGLNRGKKLGRYS